MKVFLHIAKQSLVETECLQSNRLEAFVSEKLIELTVENVTILSWKRIRRGKKFLLPRFSSPSQCLTDHSIILTKGLTIRQRQWRLFYRAARPLPTIIPDGPYFGLVKYGIHTELNGNVAPNKFMKFMDGSFGIVEIAVVDC